MYVSYTDTYMYNKTLFFWEYEYTYKKQMNEKKTTKTKMSVEDFYGR